MKKCIFMILIGILAAFALRADGVEIIYPKTQNPVINAPSTFFVGHENPATKVKINNQEVELSKNGGFFYPVDLKKGENIFKITAGLETKTYKITRKESVWSESFKTITTYETPMTVVTIKDNVPLRSFPCDYGITRLQHFDKGIPLTITGEYNGFYRVQLARDDFAWIDKKSVTEIKGYDNSAANVESFIYEENPEGRVYTMKLSKKVPYILSERRVYKTNQFKSFIAHSDGLDLVVYNVKDYPENKYEIHLNRTGVKDFGYKIYYKNNNELIIEVKNFPKINPDKPLEGIKITLDAGHGGGEYGAIGCLGTKEKDVNLQIVLKLKKQLESQGAIVFLTRETDRDIDLHSRTEFSKVKKSDIFLSIHNDSLADGSKIKMPSGSTAYYYYDQSAVLASKIVESLTYQTGLKNNGIKQASFAVVRNTESPSVLLETAYMINPYENEKLIDKKFQDSVAKAITKGIVRYLNE